MKTNYKRGQSQKWWRRENVEIRLEFFESLNGTTDFLLWNSEQGTGVENGFSQEIKFNKALKIKVGLPLSWDFVRLAFLHQNDYYEYFSLLHVTVLPGPVLGATTRGYCVR